MADGLILKYYVLKPASNIKNDPYAIASREALRAYEKSIRSTNSLLADQLVDWVVTAEIDNDRRPF